MNSIEKLLNTKRTENGDISYKTTGDNLTDILFMTAFFEKHLDEVRIGTSDREKLFSMFVRDPRFGLGRRDLGRELMKQSKVSASDIVLAGRYDDLWHIPTDDNLVYLYQNLKFGKDKELAKKWMPRLTTKDRRIAKALCKEWGLSEREYRKLIKTDKTVEFKLSYAEKQNSTPLNDLFKKDEYNHPLVDSINFEQVPSLAMTKYLKCFSTREDIKDRFNEYMQQVKENKAKVNVSTATVHDSYKTVNRGDWTTQDYQENADILGKKIVENATIGLELDAICVLDTSGSMYSSAWNWSMRRPDFTNNNDIGVKAMSVCHGIATHSTYAKNQLISFSSEPRLMTIKGDTLQKQYQSMYTGDCSNTDLGAVFKILMRLKKFPEYVIVMSDMEFDKGSRFNVNEWQSLVKQTGANTKLIWWNFNDRNKTVPEFDENGNIFLSGYNLQILKLLETKFNMSEYIDKLLSEYSKKIDR